MQLFWLPAHTAASAPVSPQQKAALVDYATQTGPTKQKLALAANVAAISAMAAPPAIAAGGAHMAAVGEAFREVGTIHAMRTLFGSKLMAIGAAVGTAFGLNKITAPAPVMGPSGPGQFVIPNYQPPTTERAGDAEGVRRFLRGEPVDVFRAVTPERAEQNIASGTFMDAINLNNTASRHGMGVYASFSTQTAQQEFLAHQAGKDMTIVRGQLTPSPTLTLHPSVAQSGGVNVKDPTGGAIIPQPKLQLQESNQ
jgi:hypothetical protein